MIHQPHDTLFRSVFSNPEHASEELQATLPGTLLQHMELGSLQRCAGDLLDHGHRKVQTDLLFSVLLGGEQALVLMEHQSTSDRLMPLRLWSYCSSIWRGFVNDNATAAKLPLIVPVVVHHGASPWSAASSIDGLMAISERIREIVGDALPRLPYYVDDLAAASDDEVRARSMSALPKLVLLVLKNARHCKGFAAWMHKLFELFEKVSQSPNGDRATELLLRYILQTSDIEPGEIGNFAKKIGKRTYEIFMTGAEKLEQQGREKERRSILRTQLERRFGKLSEEHDQRVENANGDELLGWLERVVVAETIEEIFA